MDQTLIYIKQKPAFNKLMVGPG